MPSPMFRAKIKIDKVHREVGFDTVIASPVTGTKLGENGRNDDNTFARWTPSGEIKLQINNPDLIGQITPGEEYLVDFTPVEKPYTAFTRS